MDLTDWHRAIFAHQQHQPNIGRKVVAYSDRAQSDVWESSDGPCRRGSDERPPSRAFLFGNICHGSEPSMSGIQPRPFAVQVRDRRRLGDCTFPWELTIHVMSLEQRTKTSPGLRRRRPFGASHSRRAATSTSEHLLEVIFLSGWVKLPSAATMPNKQTGQS